MARSLLEDFDKKPQTKQAAAKPGKGGGGAGAAEKDPKAKIKLLVAIAVLVVAVGIFAFQQGWFSGGGAAAVAPNIPPDEATIQPNTTPPTPGEEVIEAAPNSMPTTKKVHGAN